MSISGTPEAVPVEEARGGRPRRVRFVGVPVVSQRFRTGTTGPKEVTGFWPTSSMNSDP